MPKATSVCLSQMPTMSPWIQTYKRPLCSQVKLCIQLKLVWIPAHQLSKGLGESVGIYFIGHCSFPVFSLSLWINCVSKASHQLSSHFF